MAGLDLDPIALHDHNVARLGGTGVVIAGYPGSGAALIGNILLEAGIGYLDPYTEVIADGHAVAAAQRVDYRSRLAASHRADRAGGHRVADTTTFVKTHLRPESFSAGHDGVLLLVRDPRDAVHSYYRWRLGFSESGERGSFAEFLRRKSRGGAVPALDWAGFNAAWAEPAQHVVRFEDLKRDPVTTMRAVLDRFGVRCPAQRLADAVRASTFEAMRSHEDAVAGGSGARIMRSGRVDEWRDWWSPELAESFRAEPVRRVAARHGYEI
jgi:hypothetical protein